MAHGLHADAELALSERLLERELTGATAGCATLLYLCLPHSTKLELDDEELDAEGFDWLLWTLRFLFLASMAAVAIWGHADLLANSPATQGDSPECTSKDSDLAEVCWWVVVVEACSAAICTGIILAQAVSSLCEW